MKHDRPARTGPFPEDRHFDQICADHSVVVIECMRREQAFSTAKFSGGRTSSQERCPKLRRPGGDTQFPATLRQRTGKVSEPSRCMLSIAFVTPTQSAPLLVGGGKGDGPLIPLPAGRRFLLGGLGN